MQRVYRLVKRPDGELKDTDLELSNEPMPSPKLGDGELLLKVPSIIVSSHPFVSS